jgi:hypothetical protein
MKKPTQPFATQQRVPVWVRDLPARQWIENLKDVRKIDEPPTPFDLWHAGKPTPVMVESLPPKVAQVGKQRIVLLCKVRRSARKANMKLIWKGRRVKYKKTGEPDHSVNVLRRIEAGEMGLNDWVLKQQIRKQMLAGNVRWFIRLGEALERGRSPKTQVPDFFSDRIDRVADFIVCFWFCVPDSFSKNVPSFCYFTDQALADLCKLQFPTASPTMLSVRQWRKRLRLLRPGPPIVRVVPPHG